MRQAVDLSCLVTRSHKFLGTGSANAIVYLEGGLDLASIGYQGKETDEDERILERLSCSACLVRSRGVCRVPENANQAVVVYRCLEVVPKRPLERLCPLDIVSKKIMRMRNGGLRTSRSFTNLGSHPSKSLIIFSLLTICVHCS